MFIIVILLLLVGLSHTSLQQTYPNSEYEFSLSRDQLLVLEHDFQGENTSLTENETIVSNYLDYLKVQEFRMTRDDFPPSRPIELMMENITKSKVYEVLYKFPKGGNMHTHENHMLSKSILLDIVWNSTDFQHLYMVSPDSPVSPWMLDFFLTLPTDLPWIRVQNGPYSKEEILQHQTLIGILSDYAKNRPTDSATRWREIDPLWTRGSTQLILNVKIKSEYLRYMMIEALKEGTQYIESRKNLGPEETIYELNTRCNETYGKCPLGDSELEINITRRVVAEVMAEYPQFIGLRRVAYSFRRGTQQQIEDQMNRVAELNRKYPQDVVAYDMVGEEDLGYSHLYFISSFIGLNNNGTSEVELQLHSAETSWPDDLISAYNDNDLVSTAENAYEAILLGAARLGHGSAYIKHPFLMNILKERKVAVETCPVSNQILGYLADLRHHPAATYLRMGIPVVLGSDDAGTFGVDFFTIDWYEIFMAWGLSLADLRQLALDSLQYSGMNDEETTNAINTKWRPAWDTFINDIRNEACSADLTTNAVSFARILPRDGALDAVTTVHLYGRNFERGICKRMLCKFGNFTPTVANYISWSHLVCNTPPVQIVQNDLYHSSAAINKIDPMGLSRQVADLVVNVSLSFDNGATYFNTGEQFTYKYTTSPLRPVVDSAGSAFAVNGIQGLIVCALCVANRIVQFHG